MEYWCLTRFPYAQNLPEMPESAEVFGSKPYEPSIGSTVCGVVLFARPIPAAVAIQYGLYPKTK